MAQTYVKLGPIGDSFASNELGIYLNPGSAQEIDKVLMTTRLRAFFKTGFLVEITKIEYDNIKIRNINARNIPLISLNVTETRILEPVEAVLKTPPTNVQIGKRYLVYLNAEGPWMGWDEHIAQFDGSNWVFTKPINKFILPVYNLGISLHYTGTYPSGTWDWATDGSVLVGIGDTGSGNEGTNPGSDQYAYNLFITEKTERIAGDEYLLTLINNIQQNGSGGIPNAAQIPILDTNNYFDGTNVEVALIELAFQLRAQGNSITTINNLITNLQNQVNQLLQNQEPPSILYEDNTENPTTIDVGGIEAGTVLPVMTVQEVIRRMLNPEIPEEIPLLWGYINEEDKGKTGAELLALLTETIPFNVTKETRVFNVTYTNKYLIIAKATDYPPIQILDNSNLNTLNAFNVRNETLEDIEYDIFEAKYISSSNGYWRINTLPFNN